MLGPTLAMEVSAWYELEHRTTPGTYGYSGDRELEATVHRFLFRAQLNYTTLESKHYIVAGLMGGALLNPDRIGAFRLGGVLPYTSEFPMPIPGCYYGELSAQDFGLLYGVYTIPFGPAHQWSLIGMGGAGVVKYIDGMGQAGAFNSGIGAGIGYTAPSKRWKIMSLFGYGIEAQRSHGEGG